MLWITLFNKLNKTALTIANKQHVHASLYNPATGRYELVFLTLKHDAHGRPYLVQDNQPHENPHKPATPH